MTSRGKQTVTDITLARLLLMKRTLEDIGLCCDEDYDCLGSVYSVDFAAIEMSGLLFTVLLIS